MDVKLASLGLQSQIWVRLFFSLGSPWLSKGVNRAGGGVGWNRGTPALKLREGNVSMGVNAGGLGLGVERPAQLSSLTPPSTLCAHIPALEHFCAGGSKPGF